MVGDITFRRIATLAITSELNAGQPPEILRMAFVRGRFCEQAADLCDLSSPEQYLLGLLSLLPAMLRISMADLAPAMPLREEIREALLGMRRRERCLLEWLESYEQADWDHCEEVVQSNGLNREELIRNYIEAVSWAETGTPPRNLTIQFIPIDTLGSPETKRAVKNPRRASIFAPGRKSVKTQVPFGLAQGSLSTRCARSQ